MTNSEKTYANLAKEKLFFAQNGLTLAAHERERLIAEAQVYATLHLANVTEQAQQPRTTVSERLDTHQRAYDHLKGMYDQMAVRYARLLDRAEKVVNDPDEEKVVECDHIQSRMLKVFRGYRFIPNEFCPKCGEKL